MTSGLPQPGPLAVLPVAKSPVCSGSGEELAPLPIGSLSRQPRFPEALTTSREEERGQRDKT